MLVTTNLVVVGWGDQLALISLSSEKVLMESHVPDPSPGDLVFAEDIPRIDIGDEDFSILFADPTSPTLEEDIAFNNSSWEDVPALLLHPRFPLHQRLSGDRFRWSWEKSPAGQMIIRIDKLVDGKEETSGYAYVLRKPLDSRIFEPDRDTEARADIVIAALGAYFQERDTE